MEKKKFMELMEKAYDTYDFKPESIFMFKALQLNFDYNEEERTCTISCPITDIILNPSGIVHGGIYAFIADSAMGHLNFHLKDAPYITLELKTSYFKATAKGEIRATARYIKEGYKVSFMECDVVNENGEMLCKTTGTFYRYEKK
ncbi:PaaI family thioesterase [Oceanobacillus piezotolerans]|uniref:PaaI family thioesterase n=1 Tax=Oceanobacillus piezotolerans TaxID=2448030 RepID=A0A498DG93_9BACI|nr:PaaI family thioesterase [Oceanobacillus piezotolerans]RLL46961.1 PaaI family thioesterase [Oceanobacillus piezotolerans]